MPRDVALDVFRGTAVAGMLIVNHPGSWAAVHSPLLHADWHGITPADVVFPMFLVAVGASLNYSRITTKSGKWSPHARIAARAALLFAIGLLLNFFPDLDLEKLRVTGVLQRIAVCYLVAALLFLHSGWRLQAGVALVLLAVYQVAMSAVPVPGCGLGLLDKDCNLASHIDRLFLAGRLGAPSYDPEGLLSTLPAISTTLLGALAGQFLMRVSVESRNVALVAAAGVVGVVSGLAWQPLFPINKNLWSPSYVLLTAGICALILAGLRVVARNPAAVWTAPFRMLGVHAIVAYVAAETGARLLAIPFHWQDGHAALSVKNFVYEQLFTPWLAPRTASLSYAIAYSLLVLAVAAIVHFRHQATASQVEARNRA